MADDDMGPDRRFFKTEWGISYTVVARDEAHATQLIRESDQDYDETHEEMGGPPNWQEIPLDSAKTITIYDECRGKIYDEHAGVHVPLAEMPMGAVMSPEF